MSDVVIIKFKLGFDLVIVINGNLNCDSDDFDDDVENVVLGVEMGVVKKKKKRKLKKKKKNFMV